MDQATLTTPRLRLDPLAEEHLEIEIELELDADPEVMRYPAPGASEGAPVDGEAELGYDCCVGSGVGVWRAKVPGSWLVMHSTTSGSRGCSARP